jgi:hypothetical protein
MDILFTKIYDMHFQVDADKIERPIPVKKEKPDWLLPS